MGFLSDFGGTVTGLLAGGPIGGALGYATDRQRQSEQTSQETRDAYVSQMLGEYNLDNMRNRRLTDLEAGYGEAEKLLGVNRDQLANQTAANFGTLQSRASQGLTGDELAAMRAETKGRSRQIASTAARAGLSGGALASAKQNMARQAAMDRALLATNIRRQSEGQLRQYTGAIQKATMGQAYGMAALGAQEQATRASMMAAGAPNVLPEKGILSSFMSGLV